VKNRDVLASLAIHHLGRLPTIDEVKVMGLTLSAFHVDPDAEFEDTSTPKETVDAGN
jgi:hypothetical protein